MELEWPIAVLQEGAYKVDLDDVELTWYRVLPSLLLPWWMVRNMDTLLMSKLHMAGVEVFMQVILRSNGRARVGPP